MVGTGARVIGGPPLPRGGLAELAVLPAAGCFEVPAGMPADEAAALLITYQTAYVGLHRRAGLRAGEWLLVHAGAGGVGIGGDPGRPRRRRPGDRHRRAARRRSRSAASSARTRSSTTGAEDVAARVREITGGHGADVVWDPVGGDVFDASRRCIAFEGRLVVVGFTSGRIPEVPAGHVLVKNYSVVGLHWGLYRSKDPA